MAEVQTFMKWVTRRNVRVDRVACPWLITRFIEDYAEFGFVPPDEVLDISAREGGLSFDAPGARYTHRDGKCTFEVLIEEHGLVAPVIIKLREHEASGFPIQDTFEVAGGLPALRFHEPVRVQRADFLVPHGLVQVGGGKDHV